VQLKDLPIRCAGFAATVWFDTFPRVEAGVVNSPRQCCTKRCEERPSDLTGAWVGTVLDKELKEDLVVLAPARSNSTERCWTSGPTSCNGLRIWICWGPRGLKRWWCTP